MKKKNKKVVKKENIFKRFKKNPKETTSEIKDTIKKFVYENKFILLFILFALLNDFLLRLLTANESNTAFRIAPLLADFSFACFIASFSFLMKKKKYYYLLFFTFIFSIICMINSIYYTYYTSYSSISSIVLLSSNKELHSVYTWILGSFNGRGWKELIFILIPSFFSILIMFIISRPLDLLTCGEETAQSLGVEVNKLRILVLICGSLAVSAAVCAGGTISFVGLIAPHIVRKIIGSKSKVLIPYSMIFGAILLLLSDTLARVVIAPSELPAGIITAILGVPFFLSLCLKK